MNRKSLRIERLAQAFLVIVALLLVAGSAAHAEDAITAALSTSDQRVTVGDPIRVVMTVLHPAGYQVLPPRLDQAWGDFTVKSVSPATTTSNPDGTETTVYQIDARLFAPGSFQTPPLSVAVTDGNGSLTQITAAPVPVTVVSVLKEGDEELRDIKAQASLPLPAAWPWILAGAAAVLALAGTLFWLIRRRSRYAVDNRLPHQRALDELAAIEAMHLSQQGRFKEHYTLVSDCIRRYVELAFSIPALERTTGEIEPDLAAASFPPDVRAALVAFLEGSDIVKFTTLTPDEASATDLLLHARTIVEATAPMPETQVSADSGPRQPLSVSTEQALEGAI